MSRSRRANAIIAVLQDRPVAYHPALAKPLGGVKEAISISQLLYWDGKGRDPDGWIYKTQVEWTEETGLSRWEQETVRKSLCKAGVIEEARKGVPGRMHFRIDFDVLQPLLEEAYPYDDDDDDDPDNSEDPETPQSGDTTKREPHNVETPHCGDTTMREPYRQECGNATNNNVAEPHCISESTSKITKEDGEKSGPSPGPARTDPPRAQTPDPDPVWESCQEYLAELLPASQFSTWFEETYLGKVDVDAREAAIVAPDGVCLEQIQRRYDHILKNAFESAGIRIDRIEYEVAGNVIDEATGEMKVEKKPIKKTRPRKTRAITVDVPKAKTRRRTQKPAKPKAQPRTPVKKAVVQNQPIYADTVPKEMTF